MVTHVVLTEDVINISQAREELKGLIGKKPDISTLIRWMKKGTKKAKLDHCRIGNGYFTSRQALTRFISACSE